MMWVSCINLLQNMLDVYETNIFVATIPNLVKSIGINHLTKHVNHTAKFVYHFAKHVNHSCEICVSLRETCDTKLCDFHLNRRSTKFAKTFCYFENVSFLTKQLNFGAGSEKKKHPPFN